MIPADAAAAVGTDLAATAAAPDVAKPTGADEAVATKKWDAADDNQVIPPPPPSAPDRPPPARLSPSRR